MAASSRIPLIAGNWKMNLDHQQGTHLVQKLAWTLDDARFDYGAVEVAVLPPFTDIRSVQTLIDGDRLSLRLGAQDLSEHDAGAYTGEVSGAFLARLGCTYVLAGHSERRALHGEEDAQVAGKVRAAHRHKITPLLCVGEPLEVRRAGEHREHTLGQLTRSLAGVTAAAITSGGLVVAYEPVWAIGTGEVATPEDAQEMAAAIRGQLAQLYSAGLAAEIRVLYGGSVKAANVAGIMAQPDVDGALVGSASIDAAQFAAIARFRSHVTVPA